MEVTNELIKEIINDKKKRIAYLSQSYALFFLYYFSDYITYKIPPFQKDFYEDIEGLMSGRLNEACWIAFRESTKTTHAKGSIVWTICYHKKNYINVDSYDLAVSEATLFDVIVALQTNNKIKEDFGELYFEKRTDENEKKLKRVGSFITTNKIKVEAFSTQQSTRGRLYEKFRPDYFVLDDIENSVTINSAKATQNIINHIDELKGGLSSDASVLYLGNYLTDSGVMRYVRDLVSKNPRGVVRDVPVIYKNGEISWKDKYVMNDEQSASLNSLIADPKIRKISLEDKQRTLGNSVYQREMMNNPEAAGDLVFDRQRVDELLKNCVRPLDVIADFNLWKRYNPSHRYAIGADTAEGGGGDSNTSCLIDFSTTPNEQVGSYANDRIAPDVFGDELKRQGDMFGRCLLAPEMNNTGFATITRLKAIYDLGKIYRREERDKISNKLTKKLGWRTTGGNKSEIIYGIKKAVEDGQLIIRDERILKEMREYSHLNLKDELTLSTRHFDLLMATAIAWAMRNWATVAEDKKEEYKQPPYEPISVYESSGEVKTPDIFNMFE